jgi:hypothetical protein
MAQTPVKIANLDDKSVSKVKALEKEIGKLVVALEPRVRVATLAGSQLERLQKLEQELGVILMAYEPV